MNIKKERTEDSLDKKKERIRVLRRNEKVRPEWGDRKKTKNE